MLHTAYTVASSVYSITSLMHEQGAKVLAETLSTDDGASVHALNLAANPIGDEARFSICQCLKRESGILILLFNC